MDRIDRIIWRFLAEVTSRSGLSPEAKRLIWLHVTKPWIPGFRALAIAPLRQGLKDYLGPEILRAPGQQTLYWPSWKWWKSHLRVSHDDSTGCNLQAHVDFLTVEGASAEFAYYTIPWEGPVHLLDARDFQTECEWISAYFGVRV